jgi:type IV pilus assembly protein PilE
MIFEFRKRSVVGARGFTLLELMIAMLIAGILAAIALPSYQQHLIRGRRAAAKSAMMDIANREQQLLIANRVYSDKTALTANGFALNSDVTSYYTWAVTADNAATPPSFLITFTPSGAQSSDGALTLNSQGTKLPADKWAR